MKEAMGTYADEAELAMPAALVQQQRARRRGRGPLIRVLKAVFVLTLLGLLARSNLVSISVSVRSPLPTSEAESVDEAVRCAVQKIDTSALDQPLVEPIPFEEFVDRRDRIARALIEEKLDAYVVEPGSDFQYLANLSNGAWEDWGPTERPFLLVIEPVALHSKHGLVRSRSTILTPNFELGRAKQLVLPFAKGDAEHLPWREEESPYAVLAEFLKESKKHAATSGTSASHKQPLRIKVGPETRTFITQGLASAGLSISPFRDTDPVAHVRQAKSEREVAILRAINTLTVDAIRATRECVYGGISERELFSVFERALVERGRGLVGGVEGLALFGERTACPHCGPSDERRLDAANEFVLMDVGARLHGYISDCTRTFLLPNTTEGERFADEGKLAIWNTVHKAQSAAIDAIREGAPLSSVDRAARRVIDKAGYGRYFTHRLGHSIGLQMHESPYANGANNYTTLQVNTPLTAEPGIYIEGYAGVRLEDVILTNAGGKAAETLTNRRANSPWDP